MVTLLILDGFGHREEIEGNAIKQQGTPNLDKLNVYPHTLINASGRAVGLIDNQMGNSEVGHMNIGAGIVVKQDLLVIEESLEDGSFYKNEEFLKAINHAKTNNSALHLIGLLSDGGVHSHIRHLKALIDLADKEGLKNVYIHAIMDGRDTLVDSGVCFIKDIEAYSQGKAKIVDICGRVYAMDREKRYDRLKKAYDLYINGIAEESNDSAISAIEKSYSNKVFDEFIEPTVIDKNGTIKENDSVIFFNYRTDRAREITEAITQQSFDGFETQKFNNLYYCCMTEYNKEFKGLHVAIKERPIKTNLSDILSKNGYSQFRVTETTKYAHVTFFFNSGIEQAYDREERKLFDSINVKNFADVPHMKAEEITESAISAIKSKEYDFVLINISNPDMIGHTGEMDSAKKAVEIVDKCAFDIAQATLSVCGDCIITADHGNIELMLDKEGNKVTSHTTSPVPFWLVSDRFKDVELIKNGKLANITPTVLKLFNIEIPEGMEKPMF